MKFLLPVLAVFGLCSAQYAVYTIDQPIDHFPTSSRYPVHTNRTFKQRYVFDASYYKPGGPVFLYLGGEQGIVPHYEVIQNGGAVHYLMKQYGGLGVILENRYYGESLPFNSTTTDELLYLTTENTIADNAYFAQHAVFPGVNGNRSVNAPRTPWFVYGVSLAGGQAAFTKKAHGDVFYGGIASSGLSHAVVEYPAWYNPIQRYAPQDCVATINGFVDDLDQILTSGNKGAIQQLKQIFGLEKLTDNRDFAATIAFPLGGPLFYPTNTWQELDWNPKYARRDFFYFCDNVTALDPPANNTAADMALSNYTNGRAWTGLGNYAAYVKRVVLPLCPSGQYDSSACFGTQNRTYWADPTPNYKRSYLYTTCTEMGYYQSAPSDPSARSLISRTIRANYTQQWCQWSFPKGKFNSIPVNGPNLSYYNNYGGYNLTADRLAFIDGSADVWRDSGWHSEYAPDRFEQDPLHPELLINGAGHGWDSIGTGDVETEPQFIREAHLWERRVIGRWLKDFASWKPGQQTAAPTQYTHY